MELEILPESFIYKEYKNSTNMFIYVNITSFEYKYTHYGYLKRDQNCTQMYLYLTKKSM